MKQIISVLLFFIFISLATAGSVTPLEKSENNCKGKWIVSTGISDMSKGLYIAKKTSLMDAYRDAVNRGADLDIQDFTQAKMTNSMSEVYSVITKKSNGFITTYDILSQEKVKPDRFETVIKACVVDNAEGVMLKNGLNMFVNMLGTPKVLFVLGQKNYDLKNNYNQNSVEPDSGKQLNINQSLKAYDNFEIKTVETAFAEYFKNYGYDIITSDDLIDRNIASEEVIAKARQGIGGYAIQLARSAGVDIVVTGSVTYKLEERKVYNSNSNIATASMQVKAVMPGSGKTVGIYNKQSESVAMLGSELSARESAISKVSDETAQKLVWDIPKYLLDEEREIELNIMNISYSTLRNIKKSLENNKGVLNIRDKGKWERISENGGGTTRISITTSFLGVTVDDILDSLSGEGFKMKILEVNDYYLKVNFL